jgi:glycerophosphoryl diester phosphodiesterase
VYVWIVNERSDIDLMLRHQVDGIITDHPAETRAHLGR